MESDGGIEVGGPGVWCGGASVVVDCEWLTNRERDERVNNNIGAVRPNQTVVVNRPGGRIPGIIDFFIVFGRTRKVGWRNVD